MNKESKHGVAMNKPLTGKKINLSPFVLLVSIFFLISLFICSQAAFADENFVAGIYQDSTGNQYLVSGPTPVSTGRSQWTINSTTPTTNIFNAIWETGAASGNTFIIGKSYTTSGYPTGQSYGIISNENWSSNAWSSGSYVISFSQAGNILMMASLSSHIEGIGDVPLFSVNFLIREVCLCDKQLWL